MEAPVQCASGRAHSERNWLCRWYGSKNCAVEGSRSSSAWRGSMKRYTYTSGMAPRARRTRRATPHMDIHPASSPAAPSLSRASRKLPAGRLPSAELSGGQFLLLLRGRAVGSCFRVHPCSTAPSTARTSSAVCTHAAHGARRGARGGGAHERLCAQRCICWCTLGSSRESASNVTIIPSAKEWSRSSSVGMSGGVLEAARRARPPAASLPTLKPRLKGAAGGYFELDLSPGENEHGNLVLADNSMSCSTP
ncbi:hypothetical protein AB1Y20_017925 [Prymnesium parvum]|uniref:Uncharacterized protein n=1 Tax=Prymnesium parvum TaxID=97485 RepID=A0AB34JQR1_PRYPA